jgi:hypothetical protein
MNGKKSGDPYSNFDNFIGLTNTASMGHTKIKHLIEKTIE